MADFMIRFFICNVFISAIIGILLAARRLFKNNLSGRMQYNLWFLLLGLLAVPFMPFRFIGLPQIFSWLCSLGITPSTHNGTGIDPVMDAAPAKAADWLNNFTLSVNSGTPSIAGYILSGIWLAGMLAMMVLVFRSALRLRALEKSALPLQNREVPDYCGIIKPAYLSANPSDL